MKIKKNDIVTVTGNGGYAGFWGTLRIVAVVKAGTSLDGYDVVDSMSNGVENVIIGEYTHSDSSGEFNEGERVAFGVSTLRTCKVY